MTAVIEVLPGRASSFWMIQASLPLPLKFTGHSSIAISSRYVHPAEDSVFTAMSRLGGRNFGHSEELPVQDGKKERLLSA